MDLCQREAIDEELEKRGLNRLKSKQLYTKNYKNAMDILDLPYWSNPMFTGLLWPNIWRTSKDNIIAMLKLPYWAENRYLHLLTPSIWALTADSVVSRIGVYEELRLAPYITINNLRKTEEQIRAIYKYVVFRRFPLVIDGRLHPFFSISSAEMQRNYGVTLDWIMEFAKNYKGRS